MNFDKIKDYMDSILELGIPSGDVAIYKDHELLFRYGTGFTDVEKKNPIKGDELYLMFSMTKIVTMTAFMQLVEKGMVSLEDEVSRYLPAYKNITLKDGSKVNSLKIKHLLSMQSGLDYDLQRKGIVRVLKESGSEATTRMLVDSFAETPFDFEPGTHFQYSLSHDVAAAVIEVVSGMRFGEYLKENIFKPLKMDRTFFAKPENDDVEGLIPQYIQKDDKSIVLMGQSCCYQLSDNYESGGAGLISSLDDYAKLGDTLACGGVSKDGVRILKESTIDIIKTNLLGEASRHDLAVNMGRKAYGYGCGMMVMMNPELISSPAPKGIFGWDGAAGSMLTMDTENRLSIVFTMHVRNCGVSYDVIHPRLRDLLYED